MAIEKETPLHFAAIAWIATIRRYKWRLGLSLVVLWVLEELLLHRLFAYLNDEINRHGWRALNMALDSFTWLASSPLGLTGIILVATLLLIFAHAYVSALGTQYRRLFWLSLLTVILLGIGLMWTNYTGQSTMTKAVVGAIIGGALGALLFSAIPATKEAQAQMGQGNYPKAGDTLGGIEFGAPRSGEMPKAGDTLGGIGFGGPNPGLAAPLTPPPVPGLNVNQPKSTGPTSYSIGEIHDNHGIIQQGPNNVVNQAPAPELRGIQEDEITNTDGSFTHRYLVEWTAEFPGDWRISAYSKSILGVDISANQIGWSGLRDGYAFTTVNRPNGRYTIAVRTRSDDPVELKHEIIR
jgi:hypothetical protein